MSLYCKMLSAAYKIHICVAKVLEWGSGAEPRGDRTVCPSAGDDQKRKMCFVSRINLVFAVSAETLSLCVYDFAERPYTQCSIRRGKLKVQQSHWSSTNPMDWKILGFPWSTTHWKTNIWNCNFVILIISIIDSIEMSALFYSYTFMTDSGFRPTAISVLLSLS